MLTSTSSWTVAARDSGTFWMLWRWKNSPKNVCEVRWVQSTVYYDVLLVPSAPMCYHLHRCVTRYSCTRYHLYHTDVWDVRSIDCIMVLTSTVPMMYVKCSTCASALHTLQHRVKNCTVLLVTTQILSRAATVEQVPGTVFYDYRYEKRIVFHSFWCIYSYIVPKKSMSSHSLEVNTVL